jgi:23S rRNA (uracil1939-C5)-methyltransferase
MNYQSQLFYKEKFVRDAFERIGKIEKTSRTLWMPIIPSKNIFFYRNKLEFTFSNQKWLTKDELNSSPNSKKHDGALGFHLPKHFARVLDIEECYLQKEPSNAIRLEIKKFALENNLSFFDIRKQNGFLRNLIIRNTSTGQWMVVIVFFYEDKTGIEKLLKHIAKKFPEIVSLLYVVNPKKNDSIFDLEVQSFSGAPSTLGFIEEEIGGLKFRIGAKSFFQTNSLQAEQLYKVVCDFAQLNGDEIVYDLYSGTGTIANLIAQKAKKVIGIEYISEATIDAKINSQINKISNTEFFSGDIKVLLDEQFVSVHGKPDIIITDPPRAGMHEDVVKKLLAISPEKIIYVSCNPATQARDVFLLKEKYSVEKVQPIDMFPHTAHVENVVQLKRK